LGDLNVDLGNPEGTNPAGLERRLEMAALMDIIGMFSTRERFSQYRRWEDIGLGQMRRVGTMVSTVCDHICSDHPQFFLNCQIKIPRMDTITVCW